MSRRLGVVVLTLGAVAVAAAARSTTPSYVSLAEGYTSASASEAIEAAPRMFSVPDDVCRGAAVVASLEAGGPEEIPALEPVALSLFAVRALDGSGGLLPRVPVAIEIDESAVEAVDRLRFQETGELALEAGTRVHLRFRTFCQTPEVSTTTTFEVRESP